MFLLLALGVVGLFLGAAIAAKKNHAYTLPALMGMAVSAMFIIMGVSAYKSADTSPQPPATQAEAPAEATPAAPVAPQEEPVAPAVPVAPEQNDANLAGNRTALFTAHLDENISCAAGNYLLSTTKPTVLVTGTVELVLRGEATTDVCSVFMDVGTLIANPLKSGMGVYVGIGTGNSDTITPAELVVARTNVPMVVHPDGGSKACAEGEYAIAEVGLSQRFAENGFISLGTEADINQCTVYIPLDVFRSLGLTEGQRASVKYDGTGSIYRIEPQITPDHVTFHKALMADDVCTPGAYTVANIGLSKRVADKGYLNLTNANMTGDCVVYVSYDELAQFSPYAGMQLEVTYTDQANGILPKCAAGNGYTITEIDTAARTVVLSAADDNLCKVVDVPADKLANLSVGTSITVQN